jgi:hypothetical protein
MLLNLLFIVLSQMHIKLFIVMYCLKICTFGGIILDQTFKKELQLNEHMPFYQIYQLYKVLKIN